MPKIGIEWVNRYGRAADNLRHNHTNTDGFSARLSVAVEFNNGDNDAVDAHFEEQGLTLAPLGLDSAFVELADMVYFSGHGERRGLKFGNPALDDGLAGVDELRLGDGVCKWIVFDCCHTLSNEGHISWFNQLTAAFRGLHYMLGFETECTDTPHRGRIFADRLARGRTIRDAWYAACVETEEDASTQGAYVRAYSATADTLVDRWPKTDSESLVVDPNSPTLRFVHFQFSC